MNPKGNNTALKKTLNKIVIKVISETGIFVLLDMCISDNAAILLNNSLFHFMTL